jgi:hypothetical protein
MKSAENKARGINKVKFFRHSFFLMNKGATR